MKSNDPHADSLPAGGFFFAGPFYFVLSWLILSGALLPAGEPTPSRPLVFGFYVNWDPASWGSLRQNVSSLTHVVPVWLHLADGQGHIDLEIDARVEDLARKAQVPLLPLLNNYKEGWRADWLHSLLGSPEKRRRLIAAVSACLSERSYAGINVDFERLQKKDREHMVEFMRALYAELHGKGFLVTQSIPIDDEAYDLKRLSRCNDFVIPMLYDEHFDTGPAGPIASPSWFERMFRQAQSQIPSQKLIVGLGSFGYDWVAGGRKAAALSVAEIRQRAAAQGERLSTRTSRRNPHFTYADAQGRHTVWFLDATLFSDQWAFAESQGSRGLALWRLGSEDDEIWPMLAGWDPYATKKE